MITFSTWAIIIPKEDSTEPALYYHDVNGNWVNEFQGGCAFANEGEARERLQHLNVIGASVVEGKVGL